MDIETTRTYVCVCVGAGICLVPSILIYSRVRAQYPVTLPV